VALPGDVARSDEKVKAAFESVFRAMVTVLGREVRNTTQPRDNTAMAIAGLCIGGMVVARSLNDSRLGDRLREAATHAALVLGGWKSNTRSSPDNSSSGKSPAPVRRVRQGRTRGPAKR